MLKAEFEFYLKNQKKLVAKYKGKYVVIKGEEVLGAYDSEIEAVDKTSETEELGTFLVQHCELGDSSISQTFHSRVVLG